MAKKKDVTKDPQMQAPGDDNMPKGNLRKSKDKNLACYIEIPDKVAFTVKKIDRRANRLFITIGGSSYMKEYDKDVAVKDLIDAYKNKGDVKKSDENGIFKKIINYFNNDYPNIDVLYISNHPKKVIVPVTLHVPDKDGIKQEINGNLAVWLTFKEEFVQKNYDTIVGLTNENPTIDCKDDLKRHILTTDDFNNLCLSDSAKIDLIKLSEMTVYDNQKISMNDEETIEDINEKLVNELNGKKFIDSCGIRIIAIESIYGLTDKENNNIEINKRDEVNRMLEEICRSNEELKSIIGEE